MWVCCGRLESDSPLSLSPSTHAHTHKHTYAHIPPHTQTYTCAYRDTCTNTHTHNGTILIMCLCVSETTENAMLEADAPPPAAPQALFFCVVCEGVSTVSSMIFISLLRPSHHRTETFQYVRVHLYLFLGFPCPSSSSPTCWPCIRHPFFSDSGQALVQETLE